MEFSFKVKTTEKPLLSDSDWSPAFSCWFFRSRVCRVGSVIRWRRSTQSLHGPSPSSSACSLPPSLNVQATLQQQLSSCPSWLPWYQKHSQHRLYLLFADVPTDVSYHKVTENRRSFTLEPLTDFYYDTSKQEVLKCNRKKAIEASLWVKLMTLLFSQPSPSPSAWTLCTWWSPAPSAPPSPSCCQWPLHPMPLCFPPVSSKCPTWWVNFFQLERNNHSDSLCHHSPPPHCAPYRQKQGWWWISSASAALVWPSTAGVGSCFLWTLSPRGPTSLHPYRSNILPHLYLCT